jgi:hypothetical protein
VLSAQPRTGKIENIEKRKERKSGLRSAKKKEKRHPGEPVQLEVLRKNQPVVSRCSIEN